jgi:hypothetical protein
MDDGDMTHSSPTLVRKHSDHDVGLFVQFQDPAEDAAIAMKVVLPEIVAQQYDSCAGRLILLRMEVAADGRL